MRQKLLAVYTVLIVAHTLCAAADDRADTTLVNGGDRVPAFECETIDGGKFSTEAMKGKVIVINFFATWCGPCLAELPQLEESLYEPFKEQEDFVLLVIGREHTKEELEAFREAKGYNLPFVADPDRAIYRKFATLYIPRNIVIGRDGVVIYAKAGFNDEALDVLSKSVRSALEREVPREEAPRQVDDKTDG